MGTVGKPQSEIQVSYDRVAERYAEEFYHELDKKPFDREVLDRFAETIGERSQVLEIGCGPGHIARYMQDRGPIMRGIDLSQEMVNCARGLNPDIPFVQGDMLALNLPGASLDGIVCFYTIIHLKREDVTHALQEMNRVLRPGGRLLLSFHAGEGELHREEWYAKPVSIFVTLFETDEMAQYLRSAGFEIERVVERPPYEFEYPTRRVYALARKPSTTE
jgi:ubiquinone/menaquinone biosynthesis C-methylase UbiE